MGSVELVLAEVGAHLAEAVPAIARFKLLPRLPSGVEEGLRDAVERGRPVPVARVRGQARQAEAIPLRSPLRRLIRRVAWKLDRAPSGSLSWRSAQPMLVQTLGISSPIACIACAARCRWARADGMSPARRA